MIDPLNFSYQFLAQPLIPLKAIRRVAIACLTSFGILSALPPSAPAQEALSNTTIQFQEDTIVEFELIDTHGYFQSTFGVLDTRTGVKTPLFIEVKPFNETTPSVQGRNDTGTEPDFRGTVEGGGVVNGERQASNLIKFRFQAGTPYAFYLDSVDPRTGQAKTTYVSTNSVAAAFSGNLEAGETGNLIKWDDSGFPRPGKDSDFDDFAIIAGGFPITPCPLKP
ncbi:MAG: hypothetical protein IGS48_06975 [Oscillatoriales cyanobacterium C42_A2020_001]|nr:hypothetical protein [Leptolyngbyaceae cyanobacterium C42_A2020_001]